MQYKKIKNNIIKNLYIMKIMKKYIHTDFNGTCSLVADKLRQGVMSHP